MRNGALVAAAGVLVLGLSARMLADQRVGQPEPAPFAFGPGAVRPLAADPGRAGQPSAYVVAEVTGDSIAVHRAPDPAAPATQLRSPNEAGAPRVFLAVQANGDWLQVLLPLRPNASRGWVKKGDVVLKRVPYRIQVDLSDRQLSLWKGRELVMREPVGVGRSVTATPTGLYYLTELLQPPNPNGPYGPFAFGTSAFSDVVTDFAGGEGTIGIHGTDDPSSIGKEVSHGCIRLSNASISRLAAVLPLGTPVSITA